MSAPQVHNLSRLLPSTPYVLTYALPLLFVSLLSTFAGAFLTLDRTRSFAPRYDALPGAFSKKKKFSWILEGGAGGLATGYEFGVHLTTFLALLVPNVSSSPSVGPKSFVPIWLLSSGVATLLAGRWKYCALFFAGISGGVTIALAISVIVHPALLTRVIFTSVTTPTLTILCLLPLSRVQHIALRTATSAAGAFGIVLAIALMANITAWSNVWERLWLSDNLEWGTAKERGMSAAWCIFFVLGIACDFLLKRKFGENPDQKWDHYLANYAANLPNSANRAGTFQPTSNSLIDRLLGKQKPSTPLADAMAFPPDDDDIKLASEPTSQSKSSKQTRSTASSQPGDDYKFQKSPEFLKKGKSHSQARLKVRAQSGRRKEGVKFRPLDELGNISDSDLSDDLQSPTSPDKVRPWLKTKASQSTMASGSATLNGAEAEGNLNADAERIKLARIKAKNGNGGTGPEYSDYEEDVTAHAKRIKRRVSRDTAGWKPEFLNQHRSGKPTSTSEATSRTAAPSQIPGAVPVPATPSLIKALDRVAAAQHDAFASVGQQESPRPGLPSSKASGDGGDGLLKPASEEGKVKGARWEDFWREVNVKSTQQ